MSKSSQPQSESSAIRVYRWLKMRWVWLPLGILATLAVFRDVLDFPVDEPQLMLLAVTLVVAQLNALQLATTHLRQLYHQTVENDEIDESIRQAGFKHVHTQMAPTYFDEMCAESVKEITIFTTWVGQYELFYQNFCEAIHDPNIKVRFLLLHPRSSAGQSRANQLHKNDVMLTKQLEFVRDACYHLNARNVEIRLYRDIPPFSLYAIDMRHMLFGVYWTHSLSTMQTQLELKGDDTPFVNNIRNTVEHVWLNADLYLDFPTDPDVTLRLIA